LQQYARDLATINLQIWKCGTARSPKLDAVGVHFVEFSVHGDANCLRKVSIDETIVLSFKLTASNPSGSAACHRPGSGGPIETPFLSEQGRDYIVLQLKTYASGPVRDIPNEQKQRIGQLVEAAVSQYGVRQFAGWPELRLGAQPGALAVTAILELPETVQFRANDVGRYPSRHVSPG
jgi:hypothetical protein